jgi:predicted AlkP superfamily pyrophosphatase or phosphodiesterase
MRGFGRRGSLIAAGLAIGAGVAAAGSAAADPADDAKAAKAPPKVVLISLDGARPDFIQRYIERGVLRSDRGLGLLTRTGVVARQNVTANPSLTAVSHIAIATGSTAVNNDIPSNSFHPVAGTLSASLSGFGAPIGGYHIDPIGPENKPTAEPLWVKLRKAGKTVVAATWPGADGATVSVNGSVVQTPDPTRVVDYGVPFGAFGGLGAQGFSLTAADFAADADVTAQLEAAGRKSFSPVQVTSEPIETITCASAASATCSLSPTFDLTYEMKAAAVDSTDDGIVNYDTLVVFDDKAGIPAERPKTPRTGPAYAKLGAGSAKFFFEGSGSKVGTGYFLANMAPDLSTVRLIRYSANYIPRNAPVVDVVDDINDHVGFWAPQPDFRIPERLSPGFEAFPDIELETAYQDLVRTFTDYQGEVAKRAIKRNPGADLVMVYFEEPDGSKHQFLLTDPRQATDPRQPATVGARQDRAKVRRYADYVEFAYKQADKAVGEILELTGPETTVFVVSDHGFAPFHTTVNLGNLLRNAGIDLSKLAIRTSGPAAHIYVGLEGREADGAARPSEYKRLVDRIATVLRNAKDTNPRFNRSLDRSRLFSSVETRPFDCKAGVGYCVNREIGQDSGDVFAQLDLGYNFDGTQSPAVIRSGDPATEQAEIVLSVPNFYGAHGHDARMPEMSATFIAAGPGIKKGEEVKLVRNIDVAPTIAKILGVDPANTVDGEELKEIFR